MHFVSFGVFGSVGFFLLRSTYAAPLEGGWRERIAVTDGIRVNISNAAVFGLKEELKLGGLEYNTCLTIFFVPYICLFYPPPSNPPSFWEGETDEKAVFEIPSNILLKKLRPHVWRKFIIGTPTRFSITQLLFCSWAFFSFLFFFLLGGCLRFGP